MKRRLFIRQSKLRASTVPHTLARARLTTQLEAITRKKLALIIAGAGYGKTTLAAQAVAGLPAGIVWYSLDETDRDLPTFLGYLAAGLRDHHPGFAESFDNLGSEASPARREMLLLDFLADIDRLVTVPLVVVLDDYHLVESRPEITGALELLIHRSPPELHFVVISRHEPQLKISRLRAMLEVVDIGEADLAFHIDEITDLYRVQLKTPVSEPEITRLHETTGGWVTGLILFYHAAKRQAGPSPYGRLLDVGHTKDYVFKYLKENIFDRLADEFRQFMVKTAIFDRIDPDLCDQVLHRRDSAKILTSLCRDHLLTFRSHDEKAPYRYHHLLQEFLRGQLKADLRRDEIRQLHMDSGQALEKGNDLSGALHHYLAGEHFEAICRLVNGMVLKDILDCSLSFLFTVLEKIPEARLYQDARLIHARAKMASVQGDIHRAIRELQNALARFRMGNDASGVSSCLKDLGYYYYLTGDIRRAKDQMEDLWAIPHADPFFPAEVAGYLILFCGILGRFTEADGYYRKMVRQAGDSPPALRDLIKYWLQLCYSYRLHCSGEFETAYQTNAAALNGFSESGMIVLLPLAYFQAALMSYFRGKPQEGIEYAHKGLALARQVGFNDDTYAWLLYSRALNRCGMGETRQAIGDADKALQIFGGHDNFWGQASVYEIFALIHQAQNEFEAAERALKKGLSIIQGLGLVVTRAALTIGLAYLLLERRDCGTAMQLIADADGRLAVSRFHGFRLDLLRSLIAAGRNQPESAVDHMEKALIAAQENHYDPWVWRPTPQVVPVLVACHAAGRMRTYIEDLFTVADKSVRDQLHAHKNRGSRQRRAITDLLAMIPPDESQPLCIQCLGPFKVYCGNREIPESAWRSASARRIFKYLVLKHGQGFIPKEILLELAWPDGDPARTNRRFHVAMTFLRKLLEPTLKPGVPSAYILRHGEGYRLETGKNGHIDVVRFLERCRLTRQPLDHYLKTAALYHGPLFQEDSYADWFSPTRERVRNGYLELLDRIVAAYEEMADWRMCIHWADQYLQTDPCAEAMYRTLMRGYHHTGDTRRLVDTYHRCRHAMDSELGCPPSAKTAALYRELTQTKIPPTGP